MPSVIVPSMARTPPTPYTSAVASDATRVRLVKNTRPYIACLMPMSRTWPALPANAVDSSSSRPNSLTSRAPETLNRSVIVVPMPALSCMASRVIACSRRPTHRAGSRNSGVSTSAPRVICQDR